MMNLWIAISALGLGFAGSFHCVGMCGPLALGLPVARGSGWQRGAGMLMYFGGKSLTYALLGALFGYFGAQLKLAGLQQVLAVALGAVMLGVVAVMLWRPMWFHRNPVTDRIGQLLLPLLGRLIQRPGLGAAWGMGMLNGLLPCGLVYMGLTAAVATGNAWSAAMFMALFGIGTMPVMLSFLLMARSFGAPFRMAVRRLTPVMLTLVGTLLILRGLNLGIPYLSPVLDALQLAGQRGAEAVSCHP